MDPATLSAMINAGSGLIKSLQPTMPAAPNQRADGYALGGGLESSSPNTTGSGATGGSTGAAYGGAWGQSYLDASNWVVSTGTSQAHGTGTSGGNGGLSPLQSNGGPGGVTPQNPFSFVSPVTGSVGGGISSGHMMLAALAIIAFMIKKK